MKLDLLQTKPPYFRITEARAIDGDAIDATIQLSFGVAIRRRIRLKDYHAPETRGATPEAAILATQRLASAIAGHVLHISGIGLRNDQHGRLVAVLLIDGKVAGPEEVLGDLQLSREAHKADLARHRTTRQPRLCL